MTSSLELILKKCQVQGISCFGADLNKYSAAFVFFHRLRVRYGIESRGSGGNTAKFKDSILIRIIRTLK